MDSRSEDTTKGLAIELEHNERGELVLIDSRGVRHAPVEGIRGFPISAPEHWLSICDAHGRELATIADLADLGSAARAALESDLARREFVPIVRRIVRAPTDAESGEWEVETDRGTTRFLVNSHDDVRRLSAQRAMIVDAQGTRYLIHHLDSLDAASQRSLGRYL
jgi:hypothetical protein